MHTQIHWPVTEPQKKGDRIDPSVKETWTAMEKLVDEVPHFFLLPAFIVPLTCHAQDLPGSVLAGAGVPAKMYQGGALLDLVS